jgi:hypothetical protein
MAIDYSELAEQIDAAQVPGGVVLDSMKQHSLRYATHSLRAYHRDAPSEFQILCEPTRHCV